MRLCGLRVRYLIPQRDSNLLAIHQIAGKKKITKNEIDGDAIQLVMKDKRSFRLHTNLKLTLNWCKRLKLELFFFKNTHWKWNKIVERKSLKKKKKYKQKVFVTQRSITEGNICGQQKLLTKTLLSSPTSS